MKPLPIPNKYWPSRWVRIGRGSMIHRVAKLGVTREQWHDWPWSENLVAVCGKKGVGSMPGFLSRTSARRCPACCRLVKIPNGHGAPFNGPLGNQHALPEEEKAWRPYKNR